MSEHIDHQTLLTTIRQLIVESKRQVAVAVNAAMTMLYWQIGKCINEEVLNNQRAEYGKQIILTLSQQLTLEYGSGWGEKQLRHCIRFAETFPEQEIVYTLCRELSWSHLRQVMFMDEPLKRAFYIEMCKMDNWSTRTLRERISSMLYERTAISKKPELTIQKELDIFNPIAAKGIASAKTAFSH